MKTRALLAGVSAIALAAVGYQFLPLGLPPEMNKTGESRDDGWIWKQSKVDYEAIVKAALVNKASFLTLTISKEVIRDQVIEESFLPLPKSTARVRVKYDVDYPIGFVLAPGTFLVSREGANLILTLHRPRVIARPSVRLLSHQVLEGGYLIDEKEALLKLQQRILPEVVQRAATIANGRDVTARSERALRAFLQPFLTQAANGQPVPNLVFRYR